MKIVYFDICSIPIFLLIIWICGVRNMTKGRAEKLFLSVSFMSLFCAVLDIWMEFVVNPVPLSASEAALGTAISFSYKLVHNATLVFYLIFLFVITRTSHRIRKPAAQTVLWAPMAFLTVLLLQNFFTHNVFSVTMEEGYSRGPLLIWLYVVAGIYAFAGMAYCIYCRRYLDKGKWEALLSVYLLIMAAVIVEAFTPRLLLEMFAIAVGMLMVLNLVMRPEESMDGYVAIMTRRAYENDLRNAIRSGDKFQLVIIQLTNAQEIRSYLGEKRYYSYINEIVNEIRQIYAHRHIHIDMYYERPGTIFIFVEDPNFDVGSIMPVFMDGVQMRTRKFSDIGVQFEPKICTVHIPEEMDDPDEIIELGHKFTLLGSPDEVLMGASVLKQHPYFSSIVHMDEILNRAITEGSLRVLYQPIYNVSEKRFESVEALSRLQDRVYGTISPMLFIPAAEANGLILRLGEEILESVYRFTSENDLEELGISYVEINMSIAQMLNPKLPQMLKSLQEKYGVRPEQINFEITETMFDNISSVIVQNVRELSESGYSFSLDDYGTGYSSIQRMSKFPLRLIKIDKSMADDIMTETGNVVMSNTIRMMHDINKKLVVEGVETEEARNELENMDCDYIQGYYYSHPLPEEELAAFLKQHNRG